MEVAERTSLARDTTRPRASAGRLSVPLQSVLIFALALVPRAVYQGRFLTVDEAYHWYERSANFLAALRSGEYVNTIFVGHPGVTTTWLGTAGLLGHEWLARLGLVDPADPDVRRI